MYENRSYSSVGRFDWTQQVVDFYLDNKSTTPVLITDIDDTILDSNLRWYEHYLLLLKTREINGVFRQPVEYAEFKQQGPRKYFEQVIKNYDLVKNILIRNATFNSGLRGVPTIEHLTRLNRNFRLPHGYITTRPDALGEQTHMNLEGYLQIVAPILLRPDTVSRQDTIEYKIQSLVSLRERFDEIGFSSTDIYYIDDYKQLIEDLSGQQIPGLKGVHFGSTSSWKEVYNLLGIVDTGMAL